MTNSNQMIYASLSYKTSDRVHELTNEQWLEFCAAWPSLWDKWDEARPKYFYGDVERITLEEAKVLFDLGFELEIKSWKWSMEEKKLGFERAGKSVAIPAAAEELPATPEVPF